MENFLIHLCSASSSQRVTTDTCEPSVVETQSQVDSGRIYQWIVDKSLTNWIGNLYLTSWISQIGFQQIGLSIYIWQAGFPNNGFSTDICHRDWWCGGVQAPRKKSIIVICKTCVIFSDSARLNTATALWYSLQQSTSGLSDLYRLHFAMELIDGTLIINMPFIQKLLLEVMMCLFQCKQVQGHNLHSLQSFKLLKQEW